MVFVFKKLMNIKNIGLKNAFLEKDKKIQKKFKKNKEIFLIKKKKK